MKLYISSVQRMWCDLTGLSRKDLKAKLEKDGVKARTIENALNSSYQNNLIGVLILGNIIGKKEDGWIVLDDVWASAMLVSRSAK